MVGNGPYDRPFGASAIQPSSVTCTVPRSALPSSATWSTGRCTSQEVPPGRSIVVHSGTGPSCRLRARTRKPSGDLASAVEQKARSDPSFDRRQRKLRLRPPTTAEPPVVARQHHRARRRVERRLELLG